jgi:hypothetical protein
MFYDWYTMKHLLLFILFAIMTYIIQSEAYIHPHGINHVLFRHKSHRARRCHDDCSLTEFKGEF